MSESTTYVGLDVHQKSITAVMLSTVTGELKEAHFGAPTGSLRKLLRWLERESDGAVKVCYEAGQTGYELQRRLVSAGVGCAVIAPSLTWRAPAERRKKNDRRDALTLAKQLAAGMLTEVSPPTLEQEAHRALMRCRDDARKALHQVRQQILKYLAQHGATFEGKTWTKRFIAWLGSLSLGEPTADLVLADYRLAQQQAAARLERLDGELEALAATPQYALLVAGLKAFRGVGTLTAMVFLTELYQFGRFGSPRALMGFLGLAPGERSSGESEQRTGITRTGNRLVRRLMVEAAWQYARSATVSLELERRRKAAPRAVVAIAEKAADRLHRRHWRLVTRGKLPVQAATAVARELVGFLWAAMQELSARAPA